MFDVDFYYLWGKCFVRLLYLLVTILLKGFFIMDELVLKMIQGQIGYNFEELGLLKQAFVRRSYTEENGGENNEVLEFIGDKALDFAVVRLLAQRYGHMKKGSTIDKTRVFHLEREIRYQKNNSGLQNNEFICDYDEGMLTKLKSKMVEKRSLAKRMDELGFAKYLIMGKSDVQNNVNEEASVKEDLFEAIVGAVAIDSEWNFNDIQAVVEIMLEPESFLQSEEETNYVRLIQEWEMKKKGVIPLYRFKEASYTSSWYFPFEGISQHVPLTSDYTRLNFHCELKLLNSLPIFRGFGASKNEARMAVCKLAYEYLEKHDLLFSIRDEIENPNKADAINQLEILARRGYFSIPIYEFKQDYDNDGNPIWKCRCHIKEYDIDCDAESSSKKDAKKSVAFAMLEYVLSEKA